MNRKVQLAFAAAILTILGTGEVSCRSLLAWGESDQRVRHTQEVLYRWLLEVAADGTCAEAIEVLLVEDSPGDVRLTPKRLKTPSAYQLHVASDGAEAMPLWGAKGEHAVAPRPDLILLDLNLPKKDGREVWRNSRRGRY